MAQTLFTGEVPDLASYDIILVNTSAGKDSQTCLRAVVAACIEAGVGTRRIVAVHADLGRVEWKGTRELAKRQCDHYGVPLTFCRRPQGDLLHQMEFERKMWPDSKNRWCTSDQKTAQVYTVMTALVRDHREVVQAGREGRSRKTMRKVRILNCLGIRGQESTKRSKEEPFRYDEAASNKTMRHVDRWYPIYDWTLDEVWADIRASGVPYHFAYDLGMPRLSCVFCVFSGRDALTLAAQHNPELAEEYAAVELRSGHQFRGKPGSKGGISMASVVADAKALPPITHVEDWRA